MMPPDWFPDWTGDVAAIVAGGESVTQDDVDRLRGRCRVIVVNNSHELAPWADLLYAADERWWDVHVSARRFAGLKVTPSAVVAKRYGLHTIDLIDFGDADNDMFTLESPGRIARGGNSGFQATNLALQFGARRILWIGFDFRGDHWHGKHAMPLRNPTPQRLTKWALTFDRQAPLLERMGVDVINSSLTSAITAYPKMTVAEALNLWVYGESRSVA